VGTTVPKTKGKVLHSKKLAGLPWLVHGFSTRRGGVSQVYGGNALNLGFTKDDLRAAVERNRELFLKALGVADGCRSWPLLTLRQIHSDLIHFVDGSYLRGRASTPATPLFSGEKSGRRPPAGDGLITDVPGLLIAVQAADCLPVIVVDKKRRAVGVFHAGWRGTVKRIVEKGVGAMQRHFGSDPRDLVAAIGPGIRGCCYEVGEEVRVEFEAQFAYGAKLFHEVKQSDAVREKYPLLFMTARAPGHGELPPKLFLDLVEANRRQLVEAGVGAKNIDAPGVWTRGAAGASAPPDSEDENERSPMCTACHPEMFFSFRADKGVTGRMMGVAGVRP